MADIIRHYTNDFIKLTKNLITQEEMDRSDRFIYIEIQLLIERLEEAVSDPKTENKDKIQQQIDIYRDGLEKLDRLESMNEEELDNYISVS